GTASGSVSTAASLDSPSASAPPQASTIATSARSLASSRARTVIEGPPLRRYQVLPATAGQYPPARSLVEPTREIAPMRRALVRHRPFRPDTRLPEANIPRASRATAARRLRAPLGLP